MSVDSLFQRMALNQIGALGALYVSITKADLVEAVTGKVVVSKKEAEQAVNIFLDSIVEALNQGTGVELRGFGSFRIRARGPRRGRNPRTGESVSVEGKRVPYFRVGKELKELINSED